MALAVTRTELQIDNTFYKNKYISTVAAQDHIHRNLGIRQMSRFYHSVSLVTYLVFVFPEDYILC